jgi:hypothetical protein
MRRIAVLLAAVAAGCAAGSDTDAGLTTREVLGRWKVVDVACVDCGARTPAEKGYVIDLDTARVVNPIGDDCTARADFSGLQTVGSRELLAGDGQSWPATVKTALAARDSVLHGFVTCDGINYAQMAFVSPASGFYFYEGGVVFALGRDR